MVLAIAIFCLSTGLGLLLMTESLGPYNPKPKRKNKYKYHEPKND
jgi:hypothetical protein